MGWAKNVIVEHNRAYLLTQNGLLIADISDPANPRQLGEWSLPLDLDLGITNVEFAVAAGWAYVPANRTRIFIVDVRDPTRPVTMNVIQSRSEFPWGITVSVRCCTSHTYNRACKSLILAIRPSHAKWALRARSVRHTASPWWVSWPMWPTGGRACKSFDVSNPRRPRRLGSVGTLISAYRITVSGNVAYVAGDEGGLRIIEVSDPTQPQEIAAYIPALYEVTRHRIATSGRYVYVPFISIPLDGFRGVRILDVSDPRRPQEVGRMGGMIAYGVAVAGDPAYVVDTSTGLRTFDISDRQQPRQLSITNTVSHLGHIVVENGLPYVAAGWAGFMTVDVNDPRHPRVLGQVKRAEFTWIVALAGDLACVAEIDGLRIIDVSEPRQPRVIGELDTLRPADGIAVSGDLVCLAEREAELRVVDVSEPTRPQEIGRFEVPGAARGVTISGRLAYVAEQDSIHSFDGGKLRILDVSNPRQPRQVGVINTAGSAWSVAVVENLAYVADYERGLRMPDS